MRGCGSLNYGFIVRNCWCLIELFLVCNVTLFFWKRCNSLVRNMLMVVLVVIKKCSLEFLLYNWRREDELVIRVVFIG